MTRADGARTRRDDSHYFVILKILWPTRIVVRALLRASRAFIISHAVFSTQVEEALVNRSDFCFRFVFFYFFFFFVHILIFFTPSSCEPRAPLLRFVVSSRGQKTRVPGDGARAAAVCPFLRRLLFSARKTSRYLVTFRTIVCVLSRPAAVPRARGFFFVSRA
jgi:hypothetical protein